VSTEHQITRKAEDTNLTIPELREFLAEYDKAAASLAVAAGVEAVPDWYGKVTARVTFRGGLKSITVTIPGGDEKR
jgi:hypothetical protein